MSKLKLNFATRVASMRTAKSETSGANNDPEVGQLIAELGKNI